MKNAYYLATLATGILFVFSNPGKNHPENQDPTPIATFETLFSVEEHVFGHVWGGTSLTANPQTFTNPQNNSQSIQVEEIQYSINGSKQAYAGYYMPIYTDANNHKNPRFILDPFFVETTPANYSLQMEAHVIALPGDWIANQYIDQQKEASFTSNMTIDPAKINNNIRNIKVMDGVEQSATSSYLVLDGVKQLTAQKSTSTASMSINQTVYYRIPDPINGSTDMRFILIKNVEVVENGVIRTIDYLLDPILPSKY